MKSLRKKKGFTLKDVSKELNVSVSYMSKVENGKEIPSLKKVVKLSKLYQVSVYLILKKLGIETPQLRLIITKEDELIVDFIEDGESIINSPYKIECQYF